jgi:hypothetical protein
MLRAVSALRRWLVPLLFVAIYLYAFPYFGKLKHANELPRVLTTQEIWHHGTFALDARLDDLGSKADISTTPNGRHFQNKAPGLSVLGVVAYAPLALGYRIAGAGMPSLLVTTWLLRIAAVTLPALLFLAVFRRRAEIFAESVPLGRDGALVAYAFGSLAFPYALLFMSHVPAAVVIGTAFVLASQLTRGEATAPKKSALGLGALLGLAMFVEYQAVFAALLIGLFLLIRSPDRKTTVPLVVAASVPFVVALALYHSACFGSPLRTGYAYSVDAANRVGFLGIVGPSWTAAKQLFTYGSNGLLMLSPWILLALGGVVVILRDRERRAKLGAEAILSFAIVVVYLVFVASLEPEFGRAGWSVGPRYIAIAMPFFGWLAAAMLGVAADHRELAIPALAMIFVGILINVLAATTFPQWPTEFENPIFEVSLRLLGDGHAPRSLGRLVGLTGPASLAPLYLAVVGVTAWLLARANVARPHLAAAAFLALVAFARFRGFATTPEPTRELYYHFIESTYEP